MAGLGRKEWSPGDTLTAADVNGYLMDQSVMVFAGTAERGSAIPTPSAGMVAYSTATGLQVYDGSSFTAITKLLQVVQATKNNVFSTTSATFTDITDLSVSITPSATTSKILVFSTVSLGQNTGDGMLRLMRDSTAIAAGTSGSGSFNGFGMSSSTYQNMFYSSSVTFLDSPATTSATTYKIQGICNTGTLYVNRRGVDTTYGGFSTITVMEISA